MTSEPAILTIDELADYLKRPIKRELQSRGEW
jgi:hypothetical protein